MFTSKIRQSIIWVGKERKFILCQSWKRRFEGCAVKDLKQLNQSRLKMWVDKSSLSSLCEPQKLTLLNKKIWNMWYFYTFNCVPMYHGCHRFCTGFVLHRWSCASLRTRRNSELPSRIHSKISRTTFGSISTTFYETLYVCRFPSAKKLQTWAQFHQCSMYSFYVPRSQKRKKILIT